MKTSTASKWLAAWFLVLGACADSGTPDDEFEDDGGDDSDMMDDADDPDPDPQGCTPDNDVVPLDMLAGNLATGGLVGDVARAKDGTVYFVSYMDLDRAEIGRRAPCGEIEKDWMSITAPVAHLEVSSDNQLYMAATGAGTVNDITARLYRLDLEDPAGFPQVLVRDPGEAIHSLSAGPNGRMFFVKGWLETSGVYYVDTDDTAPTLALDLQGGDASIAAKVDGSVFVFREYAGAYKIGRLTLSATGTPNIVYQNITDGSANDYRIYDMRADATSGFYAMRMTGIGSAKTYTLFYAPNMTGARMVVGELTNVSEARVAFALDGDPKNAVLMSPAAAEPMTSVTLPAPMMMP